MPKMEITKPIWRKSIAGKSIQSTKHQNPLDKHPRGFISGLERLSSSLLIMRGWLNVVMIALEFFYIMRLGGANLAFDTPEKCMTFIFQASHFGTKRTPQNNGSAIKSVRALVLDIRILYILRMTLTFV